MNDINYLKSTVSGLKEELRSLGPIMRGSVTMIGNKKKQAHFLVSMEGKTRLVYLGEKRKSEALEYTENYKRLMEIVQEMTKANMQILKLQRPLDKRTDRDDGSN